MPKFNVCVPHSLSQEEATQRLDRFVDLLREKFRDQMSDFEQSWEGDTLRFRLKTYGMPLQGQIAVTDQQLNLDGQLPLSAMIFKGKIEALVHEQLAQLVAGR